MSEIVVAQKKQRIAWIDIAKGIAILTVIWSHSLPYGSLPRNLIFCFHMPLFFIVSGFTLKPANSIKDLIVCTKKDFVRLIVPVIFVTTVSSILAVLLNGASLSAEIRKVWSSTHKAVFTDEAFLHYRLDNESSSVNNPGKIYNVRKEYAEIEDYLRKNKIYDNYAEIMQMAKFGAYYWNIYRLAPGLRKDFVKKAKDEFLVARDEGSLNKSLFLDASQWNLLNYILDHNVDSSLRYIRFNGWRANFKQKAKKGLKTAYMTIRPTYKKQLEISSLIKELEDENMILKQKIKELERKTNSDKIK